MKAAFSRVVVLALIASSTGWAQEKGNGNAEAGKQFISPSYEHLKVLEPLIGESTGTWGDGTYEIKDAKRVWKWGDGKGCILCRDEFPVPAEMRKENKDLPKTAILNGIIGWDPVRKEVTNVWQSNWGLSGALRFHVDGNKLKGTTDHKLVVDGDPKVVTRHVTWEIGPNGMLTVKSVNLQNDGVNEAKWLKKK